MPAIPKTRPRALMGQELGKALIDLGFIKPEDNVRRLIIDVAVGEPVRLYLERFGSDVVLDVFELLRGTKLVDAQALEMEASDG